MKLGATLIGARDQADLEPHALRGGSKDVAGAASFGGQRRCILAWSPDRHSLVPQGMRTSRTWRRKADLWCRPTMVRIW